MIACPAPQSEPSRDGLRSGTTTLFAALDVLTGMVIRGVPSPRPGAGDVME